MDFYVYGLRLKGEEFPFYIGKGRGNRIHDHFRPASLARPTEKNRVIKRAKEAGIEVIRERLFIDMSEKDAYSKEECLISTYGRLDLGTGCLTNLCNGGRHAASGAVRSSETRAKMSLSWKLRGKVSDETKAKLSAARLGKSSGPQSSEARAKKSAKLMGRIMSEETKAKMKLAWEKRRLTPVSEETRKKLSDAGMGRIVKEETKIKIRNTRKSKFL